jgi:hypothetical protein
VLTEVKDAVLEIEQPSRSPYTEKTSQFLMVLGIGQII